MRSIELFAGAGGLGLGAERGGTIPQLVVERDRWCCDTISANRKDVLKLWPEPLRSDINHVDFRHLDGGIDIVTGGPPCQPFSLGGKHKAHDDHRDMWSQAVRAVRETRPKAFVFENVKGLTRSSFSDYLSYIFLQLSYPMVEKKGSCEEWHEHLSRLEQHHTSGNHADLHYQVIPPKVLNAANYGVPQRRERVFFVGFRSDLGANWTFPKATHSLDALLHDQSVRGAYWDMHNVSRSRRTVITKSQKDFDTNLLPWKTVRDALIGLPDPQEYPERSAIFKNHRFQPGAKIYPGHTGSPIDLPAKALKAGVHGVPGGENMMVKDDGSVRYFTIRESARLQTFPDEFEFSGSWSEAMRQLGNAVPVDLAHAVTESVIEQIAMLSPEGNA